MSQCARADILEDYLIELEQDLLSILLSDFSSRKNIVWATDDYRGFGEPYRKTSEIFPHLVTREHNFLIQPRAEKPLRTQQLRIRKKGEVFTPSWVCNEQNNLVDDAWFGRSGVFNATKGSSWTATKGKILFSAENGRDWQAYVDAKRLEITCGEAPYLVSRYDTTTGDVIPLRERIGFLDRKLRVVSENAVSKTEWLKWATRAIQSVYGYEFQGDSLLIARENVFMTFVEYYSEHYGEFPESGTLKSVAEIVSRNLWQMDAKKGVVPYSCKNVVRNDNSLFGSKTHVMPCPGCSGTGLKNHTGIYCKITDWLEGSTVRYVDLIKGRKADGSI